MKSLDEIVAENAMLKLQLETLYDGQSYRPENSDIPAEVENMFLKNVLNFEKRYKDAPRMKVFDLLGRPDLPALTDVNESTVQEHLEAAVRVFEAHGIDFLYEDHHDKMLVYKYMVDVLFDEEVEDMRSTGMHMVFFFEEYLDQLNEDL